MPGMLPRLVLAIGFACALICPALLADTLGLSVLEPDRINTPGTTYTFQGTVTNHSGETLDATDLFLNFADFDPTVISPNQLLGLTDFTLPDGGTSPVVDLFSIDFATTADPTQTYIADVSLEDVSGAFFSSTDTVVIAPIPEPRGLLLLAGICLLLFARRGKVLFGLACMLAMAPSALRAQQFSTGVTGQALVAPKTLGLEIPLINAGTAVSNVQITGITLRGATLQTPTSFPVSIGAMAAGAIVNVYADFDHSALTTGQQYLLTVRGQYTLSSSILGFAVNQFVKFFPANTLTGDTVVQTRSDSPNTSQGPYTPGPTLPDIEEANPGGPGVPDGPPRPGPVNDAIAVDESLTAPIQAPGPVAAPAPDPSAVKIVQNTAYRLTVDAGFSTEVNDPSGASSGNLVLVTGNTFALFSNDAGKTFTYVNPTTIFPNDANNLLCCDQVVLYAPQVGRFFWLLQYQPKNGVNLLRLATATAADLAARGVAGNNVWVYYDLTSATFALGTKWMDYPGLAIGNNHLYISANVIDDNAKPSKVVGALNIRYPLADFAGVIVRDWIFVEGDVTSRVVQNTGDTGYWASHFNSSTLHLWRQPEGSMRCYQRQVEIPSWPNIFGDYDSITPAPSSTNWLRNLRDSRGVVSGITGSTRSDNQLWFAWTAAKGTILSTDSPPRNINIPQPHIEAVIVLTGSYRVPKRIVLFSRDYAYAYPALATNANGEVGISMAYGGNTKLPNHAVGFFSDPLRLKKTTDSNSAATRWGDYMSIQAEPDSPLFSATGHGQTGPFPDPHYVRFGRTSDVP